MGGLGARTRDREQLFDWIHVKVGLWLGVDMGGVFVSALFCYVKKEDR